jgi:hypothetical protein
MTPGKPLPCVAFGGLTMVCEKANWSPSYSKKRTGESATRRHNTPAQPRRRRLLPRQQPPIPSIDSR